MVVYDLTTWIGAYLGLSPDRIYLHASAAEGARAILRTTGRQTIARSELPAAFRRLRCSECEDCLCIYKSDLARISSQE